MGLDSWFEFHQESLQGSMFSNIIDLGADILEISNILGDGSMLFELV